MANESPRGLARLLREVRACRICAVHLPHGVRPVLQAGRGARVLVAGQAPGRRVHETGVPFDDPSGDRLREWMGVSRRVFYDAEQIAILPMGFCFPGTGRTGDLPPRPECAPAWRRAILDRLPSVEITLLLGRHAIAWHLGAGGAPLAGIVRSFREHLPRFFPLPHPSPRNNAWLSKNPWFAKELLPELRRRVGRVLS